ncbi:MAG: hypothetical protein HQK79_22725, partial [Desulfobacterales bacterium]|nr:hypothetical protein [Desulfobacterales bacterium]
MIYLYLFLCGFVSILTQVIILRELNVAFFGTELIYIIAIGIWLFFTAIGAYLAKKNYIPSNRIVKILFLLVFILIPIEIALISNLRIIFGGARGTYLPFLTQIISLILVLLPIGIVLGLLFQFTTKLYVQNKPSIPKAYAIESLGGLFGGLISTLLLAFGINNFTLFNNIFTKLNHPNLIACRDSPYGRIVIENQKGDISIFENDILSSESKSINPEIFANLAMLSHKNPERVLIVGGSFLGLWKEVLKHSPKSLDIVELNKTIMNMIKDYIPHEYPDKSNLYIDDPRIFLTKENFYDIILLSMSDISSGLSNRFFTYEYFKLCSNRLKKNGILSFQLNSPENFWTPFIIYRNASIYNALKSVFKNILILPGIGNIIFIASNSELYNNPSYLIEESKKRKISNKFVSPQYINYVFTNERRFDIEKFMYESEILLNTDLNPICYRYSSLIWLSKFFPNIISINKVKKEYFYFLIIIPFILLFLKNSKLLAVGLIGFLGMILETVLIIYYQIKCGALFQNIGILIMMFMFGLTSGAWFVSECSNQNKTGKILSISFTLFSFCISLLLYKNSYIGILLTSF